MTPRKLSESTFCRDRSPSAEGPAVIAVFIVSPRLVDYPSAVHQSNHNKHLSPRRLASHGCVRRGICALVEVDLKPSCFRYEPVRIPPYAAACVP
jgi:hypothetical protein